MTIEEIEKALESSIARDEYNSKMIKKIQDDFFNVTVYDCTNPNTFLYYDHLLSDSFTTMENPYLGGKYKNCRTEKEILQYETALSSFCGHSDTDMLRSMLREAKEKQKEEERKKAEELRKQQEIERQKQIAEEKRIKAIKERERKNKQDDLENEFLIINKNNEIILTDDWIERIYLISKMIVDNSFDLPNLIKDVNWGETYINTNNEKKWEVDTLGCRVYLYFQNIYYYLGGDDNIVKYNCHMAFRGYIKELILPKFSDFDIYEAIIKLFQSLTKDYLNKHMPTFRHEDTPKDRQEEIDYCYELIQNLLIELFQKMDKLIYKIFETVLEYNINNEQKIITGINRTHFILDEFLVKLNEDKLQKNRKFNIIIKYLKDKYQINIKYNNYYIKKDTPDESNYNTELLYWRCKK
ncbi:hypothetical protein [Clostridium botulinum]|uniref:hypothetical protein n=2 Tax=Clostridium botulinum TaxID=1491 RepID=UPI0007746766|nr:hypothetical protein [Clostridium botulinum]